MAAAFGVPDAGDRHASIVADRIDAVDVAVHAFLHVDRDGALKQLHDELSHALSDDEVERRKLSKALLPHVQRFYADYIDPARHEPFYRPSSRV